MIMDKRFVGLGVGRFKEGKDWSVFVRVIE